MPNSNSVGCTGISLNRFNKSGLTISYCKKKRQWGNWYIIKKNDIRGNISFAKTSGMDCIALRKALKVLSNVILVFGQSKVGDLNELNDCINYNQNIHLNNHY